MINIHRLMNGVEVERPTESAVPKNVGESYWGQDKTTMKKGREIYILIPE